MPSGARTAWPSFSLLPTIVMSVHPSPLVRLLVSFYDIERRKSRFWHLSGLPKAFHALAAGGQDREQASLRPLDLWCRRAHVSSRSSHSHWIRHRRRSSGPAMVSNSKGRTSRITSSDANRSICLTTTEAAPTTPPTLRGARRA